MEFDDMISRFLNGLKKHEITDKHLIDAVTAVLVDLRSSNLFPEILFLDSSIILVWKTKENVFYYLPDKELLFIKSPENLYSTEFNELPFIKMKVSEISDYIKNCFVR